MQTRARLYELLGYGDYAAFDRTSTTSRGELMVPRLLVLDDYEGRIAGAPGMARLGELAEVTVLDRPLGDGDLDGLAGVPGPAGHPGADPPRRRPAGAAARAGAGAADGRSRLPRRPGGGDRAGIVVALSRRAQMASASVPQLTFALMLAVLRRIHPLAGELAAGDWPEAMGGTLAGRTLGLLGLGRHGRPVARIAAAFGMGVLAWDRTPGRAYADDEPVAERLSLDDLLARSDVVSVHLKLSPESTGLLDRDRLARMKPGAILVNTARGAIVDEPALVEALADPGGWPGPAWTCSPPSPCPPAIRCAAPPTWSSPISAGRWRRCSPSGPRSPPTSSPPGSTAACPPPRSSTPPPPGSPATASAAWTRRDGGAGSPAPPSTWP